MSGVGRYIDTHRCCDFANHNNGGVRPVIVHRRSYALRYAGRNQAYPRVLLLVGVSVLSQCVVGSVVSCLPAGCFADGLKDYISRLHYNAGSPDG